MKKTYDLLIMGAGASGLVCAVEFKQSYPEKRVAILEKMSFPGKKILVTGNGRCNLTNEKAKPEDYNHPGFVKEILEYFSPKSNIEFFKNAGLLCTADEEGRVYPLGNSAAGVLNCLKIEAQRLGIEIITDCAVKSAVKKEKFIINGEYESEYFVVASGGKSAPAQGSDGSGYDILSSFGHKIIAPRPSLVQLCTENSLTKQLKGIRVKARAALKKQGKIIGESEGEVLFTDYGLSGIAIMDLSRFATREDNKNDLKISLDISRGYGEVELEKYLCEQRSRNNQAQAEYFLTCLLPPRAGQVVMKKAGLSGCKKYKDITDDMIKSLVNTLKNFEFEYRGTKGFDMSQVTSGGADTREFDKFTLKSKIINNLYCCGEALDVDSRCGGFNLQWAWSSGRTAGRLTGIKG